MSSGFEDIPGTRTSWSPLAGTHIFRTPVGFWIYTVPNTNDWEFFETLPDTLGIPGDVIPLGPKPNTSRPPSNGVVSSAKSWEEFFESPEASPDFNCNSAFVINYDTGGGAETTSITVEKGICEMPRENHRTLLLI